MKCMETWGACLELSGGVAEIKGLFLTHDKENLYFLVRFWDLVYFNLNPKSCEILMETSVNIYEERGDHLDLS